MFILCLIIAILLLITIYFWKDAQTGWEVAQHFENKNGVLHNKIKNLEEEREWANDLIKGLQKRLSEK